jgi:hypothetical protein
VFSGGAQGLYRSHGGVAGEGAVNPPLKTVKAFICQE